MILTSGDHDVDVTAGGKLFTSRRPGMEFAEHIFSGESGDFFRHVNTDSWVYLEKDGPCHFIEAPDLSVLAEQGTLRKNSGGERALLPRRAE